MLRYAGTNGANYKTLRERIDELKRELDLWKQKEKEAPRRRLLKSLRMQQALQPSTSRSLRNVASPKRAPSNSDDDYESEEERPMTKRSKH